MSGIGASVSSARQAKRRPHTAPPPARLSLSARGFPALGGDDFEAGRGDILVVGPETPDKFNNLGPDRLDIICIHAWPRMIKGSSSETRPAPPS